MLPIFALRLLMPFATPLVADAVLLSSPLLLIFAMRFIARL